jgi:hypothetical protein
MSVILPGRTARILREMPAGCCASPLSSLASHARFDAFNNDQDVDCISSDDSFPDLWREYAVLNPTVMTINGKEVLIPARAYFTKNLKKCECPQHNELRGAAPAQR